MSNFDDDEDNDFNFGTQSDNKLASLFNVMNAEASSNTSDSLKYKAPKQPQAQPQSSQTGNQNAQSSPMFFTSVQAFKYVNNRYEPQGKLGLAILNNQNTYKLVLYITRNQPVVLMIKIGIDFKIALQKNNYSSFYDESKQLWSILFDNEELIASFATQLTLCKCNLLQGNVENSNLQQDLKLNDSTGNIQIDANDAVEIETLITLWKDMKLSNVIENTQKKPNKFRLGKNKLPKKIEDLLVTMKQGDRKLFVINGNTLQSFYENSIPSNSVVFCDLNVLAIKKNEKKDRTPSNADQTQYLPQLSQPEEVRTRSESIKEKTKLISDQLNDPKLEKAKLLSRMAKMGQPIIPSSGTNQSNEILENMEEWQKSDPEAFNTEQADLTFMQNTATKNALQFQQQQQQQQLIQQQQQQQLLQQQLLFQNQFIQANTTPLVNQFQNSVNPNNNQLALFKTVSPGSNLLANPQLIVYPTQAQMQPPQQYQAQSSEQNQTVQGIASTEKIIVKLDIINDKLDGLKSLTSLNNQNMPSMETNILLQNIQRIVKENEQYKKDLYEKSNKIEEQNLKITELLMKAQNYVEQSHLILEQKNSSYQTNAEKNVHRVLELEQDKMRLTGDLSKLTGQISELNLEINRMQKAEADMKQQLSEVSKSMDGFKQTNERLLIENADLQTKLDAFNVELKKEKQLRKSVESKQIQNEEEINELRSSLNDNQKLVEEKKKKFEIERARFDTEIEDLKKAHQREINEVKEKLNKLKSKSNEMQSEQVRQTEIELNQEWQAKLDKSLLQLEQKYDRQINILNQEKNDLEKQLIEAKEAMKTLKLNATKLELENESLTHKLDDLSLIKEKFERLQSQAIIMKERYENRIKELLDADPDPEIIGEEVKQVMNLIYRQLKQQIKPEQAYAGNGILVAMLKIIKMHTLRILKSKSSEKSESNESEEENLDFFSEHILVFPKVEVFTELATENKQSTTNSQSISQASNNQTNADTISSKEDEHVGFEEEENKFENSSVSIDKRALSAQFKPIPPDTDSKISLNELESPQITNPLQINENKTRTDSISFRKLEEEEQKNETLTKQITSRSQENLDKATCESNDESNEDDDIQLIEDDSHLNHEENLNKQTSLISTEVQVKNNDEELHLPASGENFSSSANNQTVSENNNETIEGEKESKINKKDELIENEDEDEDEDDANEEFHVYEKTTAISKQTLQMDHPEIKIKNENTNVANKPNEDIIEKESSEIIEKEKPPPVKTKGLFDDDEEDDDLENEKLFSFIPLSASNKLKTDAPSMKTINVVDSGSSVTTTKNKEEQSSASMKFSPPPLLENDDPENENDIDWFK